MRSMFLTSLILALLLLASCGSAPRQETDASGTAITTAAEANAALGLGYLRKGNYAEALRKLKKALKQDPDSARAHHYIAELYSRLGETDLADKHFARALKLTPRDASLRNNYGVFLCTQQRFSEAEEQFQIAMRDPLYPGRAESYENAALCALDAGEETKAENYFHAALKLNPRLPKSLFKLAEINFQKQRYLPARAYLQRYEAVAPAVAETLWLGFRIEKAKGNEAAAAQYGRRLEQSYPDFAPWRRYQEEGKL